MHVNRRKNMRASKYSFPYRLNNKYYLVNFVKGTIDEISFELWEKFAVLKTKPFFEFSESGMESQLIQYLQERGHLTSYSVDEEERENEILLKQKHERTKVQTKKIILVLDKDIGNNWCSPLEKKYHVMDRKNENCELDSFHLKNLFSRLKELDETRIDLWLSSIDYDKKLKLVSEDANKSGIDIKTILIFQSKDTNDKYDNKYGKEIINTNYYKERINCKYNSFRGIFQGKQYYSCPFIYNSIFLDIYGNMDFCIENISGENKKCRCIFDSKYDENIDFYKCKDKECVFYSTCNFVCKKYNLIDVCFKEENESLLTLMINNQ